jgi:hypothetical protein
MTTPRADVEVEAMDGFEVSRRQLFGGGLALAGITAATLLLDTEVAEASSVSDSTHRRYGAVTIIGDSSVMFGITLLTTQLKNRQLGPYVCDARPARTLAIKHPTVATALEYIKSTTVKKAVVIALGGGDTGIFKHSSAQITASLNQVLNRLGPTRQIGLSTQWSPRAGKYADRYNNACWAAARARPNVFVGDWAAKVKANPSWFGTDDAHYKPAGVKARNAFLADMALKAAKRVK